eukprot:1139991-Pelagomonas_calceolata.AAC.7
MARKGQHGPCRDKRATIAERASMMAEGYDESASHAFPHGAKWELTPGARRGRRRTATQYLKRILRTRSPSPEQQEGRQPWRPPGVLRNGVPGWAYEGKTLLGWNCPV